MRVEFSDQYGVCCAVIQPGDTAEDLIDHRNADEFLYFDKGEGEYLYCVQFPGRPQELFTEDAFRRSLG